MVFSIVMEEILTDVTKRVYRILYSKGDVGEKSLYLNGNFNRYFNVHVVSDTWRGNLERGSLVTP